MLQSSCGRLPRGGCFAETIVRHSLRVAFSNHVNRIVGVFMPTIGHGNPSRDLLEGKISDLLQIFRQPMSLLDK